MRPVVNSRMRFWMSAAARDWPSRLDSIKDRKFILREKRLQVQGFKRTTSPVVPIACCVLRVTSRIVEMSPRRTWRDAQLIMASCGTLKEITCAIAVYVHPKEFAIQARPMKWQFHLCLKDVTPGGELTFPGGG